MKILHSVFTGGWGGLEKYPLTLFERFNKKGHEIIIVTIEGTKLHKESLKRGIKVYTIPKFKKLSFNIVKELKEIIKKEEINLVHMNSSRELYNWYFALLGRKDIKLFLTFHIGVPNHKELLHKILYRSLDGVFSISTQNFNEMLEKLPVATEKIHLVFNGVDLEKYNPRVVSTIREELGLKNSDLLITAVGNLSRRKGVFEFLEAAKKLSAENNNLYFIWAGDGSYTDSYTLDSLRFDVKDYSNIRLLGYREDIPSIMSGSDLFVLPAYEEAFGLVYVEAMASGLPIIGCQAGGVVDIIDSDTGVYCVAMDSDDLTQKIKLMANREKLDIMKNSVLEKAKFFSMETYVEKLISIYMGE